MRAGRVPFFSPTPLTSRPRLPYIPFTLIFTGRLLFPEWRVFLNPCSGTALNFGEKVVKGARGATFPPFRSIFDNLVHQVSQREGAARLLRRDALPRTRQPPKAAAAIL